VGLQETAIFSLRVFTVVCILLSGLVINAFAGMNEFESCRCKNGLATKGDPKQEVQQECGQPVLEERRGQRKAGSAPDMRQ
jgi:hypothetical protein